MSNNIEKKALDIFKEILEIYYIEQSLIKTGTKKENKIVYGNCRIKNAFQYGDLRIETNSEVFILEHDGSGNVTNFVKYWFLSDMNNINKNIVLYQVYKRTSQNDYGSHIDLCNFLLEKIKKNQKNKIEAHVFSYKFDYELYKIAVDFVNRIAQSPISLVRHPLELIL